MDRGPLEPVFLDLWFWKTFRPSPGTAWIPESSSNVHQTIFFEASFLDVTSGSKIQNPGSGPLAAPAGQCEDPLSGSWILDLQEIAFFGEIRRVKSKIQDPSDLHRTFQGAGAALAENVLKQHGIDITDPVKAKKDREYKKCLENEIAEAEKAGKESEALKKKQEEELARIAEEK